VVCRLKTLWSKIALNRSTTTDNLFVQHVLKVEFLQGRVATDLRGDGSFDPIFFRSSSMNLAVKEM